MDEMVLWFDQRRSSTQVIPSTFFPFPVQEIMNDLKLNYIYKFSLFHSFNIHRSISFVYNMDLDVWISCL